MMNHLIGTIGLSATLLGAGMASSPVNVQAATLSSLALGKNDVPAAYRQLKAASQTIQSAAGAAGVGVATLRAKGWIGEYDSGFTTGSSATLREIDSGVAAFKGAQGARWDLANGLRLGRQQLPHAKVFTVRGLGQQAAGISASGKTGGVTYSFVFIAFREGAYVGAIAITAGAKAQGPSPAEAQGYAKVIDGRLRHIVVK